jgi:lipopolysaccharide biosynthesis regulator YciM
VIEIDPKHLQAHLNLISVYERMKNWGKAIEEIEIVKWLAGETQNQPAMSIAERKLKFIKGRMNLTEEEMKRKTEPPFN